MHFASIHRPCVARPLCVVALWGFGVVSSAAAKDPDPGPFQFGNVIYTMPEGKDWGRGHHKDHVSIYNFELDPSVVLQVHLGETTDRAIDKWLESRMKVVLEKDDKVTKPIPVTKKTFGKTEFAMAGQIVNRDTMQLHAAFRVKDRLEHVWAHSDVDEKSTASFAKTFTDFLDGLKFVNDGAKSVMAPPKPGGLEGIYYSAQLTYGVSGLETSHNFYYFSKAGWFFDEVPSGRSLGTVDPAKAFFAEPRDSGSYAVNGRKLILRYASGDVEEEDFEPAKDGLKIGGHHFQRVPQPADGTKLDATFSTIFFASFTPGSGVVGGTGGGGHHTFGKDGSYETDHWSTAFGNFENAAGDYQGGFATGNKDNVRRGKYAIKDGLATITLDNGDTVTRSILLVGDSMLFLDGAVFLDRSKSGD